MKKYLEVDLSTYFLKSKGEKKFLITKIDRKQREKKEKHLINKSLGV